MEEKFGVIKSIVIGILFVGVLVTTFLTSYEGVGEEMYTTFQSSNIPVLYMQTEGGKLINPAYGYKTQIDAREMFAGITPLYENRDVNVYFYNYGSKIIGLSYQVRDIESDQLLEDTTVKNVVNQDDYAGATLNIKNLIEKDKEYLLTLTVNTDKDTDIHYYQRILWTDNLKLDEKLDFALTFNAYTYNKDQLSNISKWIETNETGDNTNFGRVNIYSTRAQIGWGDLNPRIEGNVTPVIWDITPTSAQIGLNYRVVTSMSSTEYEAYTVKDYYRLAQRGDTIYLMDYEREANQIFDAYNDLQSSGRINLGVKSELKDIEAKANQTGKASYFVQNGNLWCYSRNDNKFTNVFSFSSGTDYRGRELLENHEIRIIDVDGDGNAYFSVSGYMNGGEHDGYMGLSLFYYNYSDNIVKELLFIPIDLSFTMMRGNVGDISYVVGDLYYVKINQYLYSIDLVSGEYMKITDQLYDDTYAVNTSGTRIAYHTNHEVNEAREITIFDLETGTKKQINGQSYGGGKKTDYVKIIGYINDDLVYGLIEPSDVAVVDGFNMIHPMYRVVVISNEYDLIKRYEDDNTYVYDTEIDGMRVTLYRVAKTEEGGYETISIDQLLNKEENTNNNHIFTEIVTTSRREKELYLNIPTSSGSLETLAVRYSKEIQFMENGQYDLEKEYQFGKEYVIYGYGGFIGKSSDISKAISTASNYDGMVLNRNGECVWKKTEGNITYPWDPEHIVVDVNRYQYNVSGINLDNVLYYVSIGKVVAARMGEDKFVYIYDYDKNDIIYYDPVVQKEVTLDRETAVKKFLQWDNLFLVLE